MAQRRLQWRHVARPTENGLAAIPSRRGPCHPAGFEQGHALAGQGQSQRGMQAAEAGADDQHFRVLLPFQGRSID
ncbi:hypothetical protein D3C85_1468970 [compost metagenome]